MSAIFAFLHHIAAFVLVGALIVEFVLISDELTLKSARKLQLADAAFGAAATGILIVGLLRVFYFEKGASYYLHSVPFVAKLSLFVVVGLLSIYPTLQILSWRQSLKRGLVPEVEPRQLRAIRTIIQWEFVGLVFIILCAALMAHGIGYVGA